MRGEAANNDSARKRVVQRFRELTLRMGEGGIERKVPLDLWSVEKVDGPNVLIRAEKVGIVGWTSADQVVSVDRAMGYFSDQIREHPNDAFARVLRATLWRDADALDKAMADCNDAARIDPRYSSAYECRASLWLDREEVEKAVDECDTALRFDPQSATVHVLRGYALMFKQKFDKAITDFDRAIELDPQQSAAYAARAIIWLAKKDYSKAVTDTTEAIRINPHDALAYSVRAGAWRCKGEYDKSISDHQEALRLSPDLAVGDSNRAQEGIDESDYDRAMTEVNDAVHLASQIANNYFCRASVKLAEEEYDQAIAICTASIRDNPEDALAHVLRAQARSQKRDFDKVIADCTAAIRIDPLIASAYHLRANVWSLMCEYDKAIEDYSEVIRLDPENNDAYAGLVWSRQQKTENADSKKGRFARVPFEADGNSRRPAKLESNNQTNKLDDFFRVVSLEPAGELCSESRFAPTTSTALTSIELGPAPSVHYGNLGPVTADSTSEGRREVGETKSYMSLASNATETRQQISGALSSQFPGADAQLRSTDADGRAAELVAGTRSESSFSSMLSREPETAVEYFSWASAWLQIGQHEKTIAYCNKAIEIGISDPRVHMVRGMAWFGKREFDKAIADYNRAMELGARDPMVCILRCTAWLEKGEFDKAILDADEVVRIDPQFGAAYYIRGCASQKKGQFHQALADYAEAIRLESLVPSVRMRQAQIWATSPDAGVRDGKKAVESAASACELTEWKDAEYVDTLAAAYDEAGDFAEAVKWQAKAIEMHKDNKEKEACASRLMLYQEKRPYREARQEVVSTPLLKVGE